MNFRIVSTASVSAPPAYRREVPRIFINTDQDTKVPYFEPPPLVASGASGMYVLERRALQRGGLPVHTFDDHILMLPLGGRAVRFQSRLDGRPLTGFIEPGRFRYLPRGAALATSWDGPLDALFLTLAPKLLAQALGAGSERQQRNLAPSLLPHENRVLAHLLHALQAFVDRAHPGGRLLEQSLLSAIAHCLVTSYAQHGRLGSREPVLQEHKRRRLTEYIRDNLGAELYLTDLAAVVSMSPCHLERAFKASTGHRLWAYVLECRAKQSAQIIVDCPEMPLSDVAARCGFASYSQFIAAFRRSHGMLPREYRSRLGR